MGTIRLGNHLKMLLSDALRLQKREVEIRLFILFWKLAISFSICDDIEFVTDTDRLCPIDVDYQKFDNTKIRNIIYWKPELKATDMFRDLLQRTGKKKSHLTAFL